MEPTPTPRIVPVEPPYDPEVAAVLHAMMPRDSPIEPLTAFRTFSVNRKLAEAMHALGRHVLSRAMKLDLHDRELVIQRVCARCGCEYERGVHTTFFGARAGLSEEKLTATVLGTSEDPVWSERESLLIRLADELHETSGLSDTLWELLARHWSDEQLLEILLVAGWYHAVFSGGTDGRIRRRADQLRRRRAVSCLSANFRRRVSRLSRATAVRRRVTDLARGRLVW